MKTLQCILSALILVVLLAGCVSPPPAASVSNGTAAPIAVPTRAPEAAAKNITLKAFAPSSLTDAAKEITAAFEAANPGVKLAIEFGHTPTQRLQLTQGATGDVFITAGQKDMNDAIADEAVAGGANKVFATNQLVVV
jgi:molybdate transport system substrate-binding protein